MTLPLPFSRPLAALLAALATTGAALAQDGDKFYRVFAVEPTDTPYQPDYFSCIRKIYDFSGKIKDSTEMSVITEKYASLREMAADLIRHRAAGQRFQNGRPAGVSCLLRARRIPAG